MSISEPTTRSAQLVARTAQSFRLRAGGTHRRRDRLRMGRCRQRTLDLSAAACRLPPQPGDRRPLAGQQHVLRADGLRCVRDQRRFPLLARHRPLPSRLQLRAARRAGAGTVALSELEAAGFAPHTTVWRLLHADLIGQAIVMAYVRRLPHDQAAFVRGCITQGFDQGLLDELRRPS